MNYSSAVLEQYPLQSDRTRTAIQSDRLIALWALSEAMLGGVLHAFQIPFTGLFVNSASVLFMVLIASFTDQKGAVIRATMIVLIVKGIVSPHSPLNAYLAVSFQGLMGEFLLRSKKYLRSASILLGAITLLESAAQKIVLLTLVYGKTLWESINLLGNFILNELSFLFSEMASINISLWLIVLYMSLHLIAGIIVGFTASKVPTWIIGELKKNHQPSPIKVEDYQLTSTFKPKKRFWLKKPSNILILIIALILIVLSYSDTQITQSQAAQAIIMIIRSLCIMVLWYKLAGPYLMKLYHKLMRKKSSAYSTDIQKTLQSLSPLRNIIYKIWKETQHLALIKRLNLFIRRSLITALAVRIDINEND